MDVDRDGRRGRLDVRKGRPNDEGNGKSVFQFLQDDLTKTMKIFHIKNILLPQLAGEIFYRKQFEGV